MLTVMAVLTEKKIEILAKQKIGNFPFVYHSKYIFITTFSRLENAFEMDGPRVMQP